MLSYLLPSELKRQLDAALIAFIDRQTESVLPEPVRDKIRRLSPQLMMQKALDNAVQRGIERFAQEYPDIDEDLADAVLAAPNFWDNAEVRKALLELVSHPSVPRPEERAQIVEHFDAVLPERRNRERVDRAVSHLLRLVAEEVWSVPGAREIREIAALQMQRLSTEAAQQQVAMLKAQMQATNQLTNDFRQALLQLTETVEQRLMLPPPAPSLPPPSPRPVRNLPPRAYAQFIGRQGERNKLIELMLPHPRSRYFTVTLDGVGGVGKSTLALELAYHFLEHYTTLPPDERFEAIIWSSAKRTILTELLQKSAHAHGSTR